MAPKKRRRKLNIFRLIFVLTLFSMVMASGVAFAVVYTSISDLPPFDSNMVNFSSSTSIYDENDNLITRVGVQNRDPVNIKQVPTFVKQAFIAVEDNRFYEHIGIDPYRILGAAWADLRSGSFKEGASTITQQLARQCTDIGTERNFKRKIQEIYLALQLERHFTKVEILEYYLNGIYFGEGAHGIQAASQIYFNKDVSKLSLAEASMLAGMPQAPSAYDPFQNKTAAKTRRNIVLDQMARYNYISSSKAAELKNEDIALNEGHLSGDEYPYPYFIDYVTQELIDKYGADEVFKGGLKVYTTLNPQMQKAAEEALSNSRNFPASVKDTNGSLQPSAAAVILDPHTGYVKAIVGGREHLARRTWNRATQTMRRPGSTFKPIISYGPAVEYLGKGPASVVDDIPTSIGGYSPKNNDGRFRGLITMRTALTNSVNIASVKLLQQVGLSRAFAYAQNLGIPNLNPSTEGLAAALGGLSKGVTALQMAAAYGAYANNGIYTEPIVIRKVTKLDNTLIDETIPKQHRAMKATTAYLITDMLRSVATSGTGTAAQFGRTMAGKTGTSDDGRGHTIDNWFAGYTANLVGITWLGNDNSTPLPGSTAFGGTYTAYMWRDMMRLAHEGLPVLNFTRPSGIVSATVDSKSGLLPGPNTPAEDMVTDLFAQGTVPSTLDNTHVLMEVCATSGKLPTAACPDRVTKVFVKLPYKVSSVVEDYLTRAPTETCSIHTGDNNPPENWLPTDDATDPFDTPTTGVKDKKVTTVTKENAKIDKTNKSNEK